MQRIIYRLDNDQGLQIGLFEDKAVILPSLETTYNTLGTRITMPDSIHYKVTFDSGIEINFCVYPVYLIVSAHNLRT